MTKKFFRFRLLNDSGTIMNLVVEPEAEEYLVPDQSTVDIVDIYTDDNEPLSLFIFDGGLSVYGHTIHLFQAGTHLRQKYYSRAHAKIPLERTHRVDEFASVYIDGATVASILGIAGLVESERATLELYRPSETGSPIVAELPAGHSQTLNPGQRTCQYLSKKEFPQLQIVYAGSAIRLSEQLTAPSTRLDVVPPYAAVSSADASS